MITLTNINTAEKFDLLLKAQKATDRYLYQYDLCLSIKNGTCIKFHDTFEEELKTLKARKEWAKKKILNLQTQVKVLNKFYDLSSGKEVREMIFDFDSMVSKFLYETKEKELKAN